MNKLKLIALKIKNFKGIKSFEIEPDGNNINISGENGTGKTTVFDSLMWLFFGKDSTGKSDFQLKPVGENGAEIHNLNTEVEGIIDIKNKQTTLKRRFQEQWTKKRGSASKEFTGHTTDYFIDDVPVKKKEYESFISGIIETNIFKLVTNPFEFNNLHWKERRDILISICGDVSDKDILSSDKKLSDLGKILGDCSIDDHKKKVAAKKRDINKELELIPARIDEVTLSLKEVEKKDLGNRKAHETSLKKHEEDLRLLKSNEAISQKQVEINEIKSEIAKKNTESYSSHDKEIEPLKKAINNLKEGKRIAESKLFDIESSIKTDEERNEKTGTALIILREEWASIDEQKANVKTGCPTCGQDLPDDQVEEAIERFNNSKAEKLKENVKKGKELKKGFDDRNADIDKSKKEIKAIAESLIELGKKIETEEKALKEFSEGHVKIDTSDLEKQIELIEAEIKELFSGTKEKEEEIKIRIESIKAILSEYDKADAEEKANKNAKLRIKELEEQEQTLAKEFEKLEAQLFLIQEFIVKKIELLEVNINSKFKMARFKMFNMQINGGIEECCETLYKGVPFNSALNNGAKINVGLDIINALSDHYGFQSVIFVDNKESVNDLIETGSQIITLTVTKDKKLTIS